MDEMLEQIVEKSCHVRSAKSKKEETKTKKTKNIVRFGKKNIATCQKLKKTKKIT